MDHQMLHLTNNVQEAQENLRTQGGIPLLNILNIRMRKEKEKDETSIRWLVTALERRPKRFKALEKYSKAMFDLAEFIGDDPDEVKRARKLEDYFTTAVKRVHKKRDEERQRHSLDGGKRCKRRQKYKIKRKTRRQSKKSQKLSKKRRRK